MVSVNPLRVARCCWQGAHIAHACPPFCPSASFGRLIAAMLLLATGGCDRLGILPAAPAAPSNAVEAALQTPRDAAGEHVPLPPTHTMRTFGTFRVVHDSWPDAAWDFDRWDRIQVFRDRQRLLQVTSDEIGPNIAVHDATGHDITGDGVPEIVLTSSSEGNHCCEDLVIYAVTPTVHRLAHESSAYCADLVDVDGDGVPELVTCDVLPDMPAVEALQCSEAERPTPTVIYRFDATTGQYRLATPDYTVWRRDALRRAVIEAEQRSTANPCALYAAALDVLYGGDRQGAERLLQRLRPADCDGNADCAERAARWSHRLRDQLWSAVRRSDRYLAASGTRAPVVSR